MKRVVSIISSPLQFLNLGEYIYENNILNYDIIILYYSKVELNQVFEVNKVYNFKIKYKIRGYPVLQYLQIYYLSILIKECQELIIGNFFSETHLFFQNKLKNKITTIVDDGMVVHNIPNYINTKKKLVKESFIKVFLKKILRIKYPHNIKLYTIFRLKSKSNISIQKNNLQYLNKQLCNSKIKDNLLIIGQPLVEKNIVSISRYREYIDLICSIHSFKKIIYFPSRKEKKSKLLKIAKNKKITIESPESCLEVFLIKNNLLPKMVVGFSSTALITLDKIFNSRKHKKIEILSYMIKCENSKTDLYNDLYDYLRNYNIKINKDALQYI